MAAMIVTFTDFGLEGPYLGQVKAVLHRLAPGVPVVDLMADAPAFDPRASAYLLAALAEEFPAGTVFFAVVDPGVGGSRTPLVASIGGRLFAGPDNGLFEPAMRRAADVACWAIDWRPARLSASFHGRDLFAPVAAALAAGKTPEQAGCRAIAPPRRPDWPDDLAAVIYIDRYGNAWTGLRASILPAGAVLTVRGRRLARARTFSDVPAGEAFWYENSSGLAEVAVNGGSAAALLGIEAGQELAWCDR
jgi:S-adenosylmethionine hydrolase